MLSEADRLLLKNGAEELTVSLDSIAIARFETFASRLHEANQHLNLTRVPAEQTVTLHFLDSLTIARAIKLEAGMRILDMGTGAGFPGMPLAIAYPDLKLTLVDATRKKLSFIEALISELHLDNVRVVHGRADELARQDLRRSFDVVTARAVAGMDKLAAWIIPFVRPGGVAVAFKSENARSEIESARKRSVYGEATWRRC